MLTLADLSQGGTILRLEGSLPSIEAQIPCGILGTEADSGKDTATIIDPGGRLPLVQILGKCRTMLIDKGLPIPVLSGARWIPATLYPSVQGEVDKLKYEFAAAVDVFRGAWGTNKANWRARQLEKLAARLGDARANKAMQWLEGKFTRPPQGALRSYTFALAASSSEIASDAAESEQALVGDIVTAFAQEPRERLTKSCDALLSLVAGGGKITRKTFNSRRDEAKILLALNKFLGDNGLAEAAHALYSAMEEAEGFYASAGSTADPLCTGACKAGAEKTLETLVATGAQAGVDIALCLAQGRVLSL